MLSLKSSDLYLHKIDKKAYGFNRGMNC